MSHLLPSRAPALLLGLAVLLAVGCTDAESVYETEPPWNAPPAGQGFLGYGNGGGTTPFCQNCHADKAAEWSETAHSNAWTDLQSSGGATEACEGCHSVSARGNGHPDESAGWAATGDPRYLDVQCESCHGPGLDHLYSPQTYQPLASLDVGSTLDNGCGECHTGSDYPQLQEWELSAHAARNTFPQGRGGSCLDCHEAGGVLLAWGVDTRYLEEDGAEPVPLTCAVCHDPHRTPNRHQLRFPIDVRSVDGNLCMRCHQRRAVPDEASSSSGPHSPEGPLLLGEAGWIPPLMDHEHGDIIGTHGRSRNPDLCVTCHMPGVEVTSPAPFLDTGHVFEAIACVDAAGIPTREAECSLQERTFKACVASGCHSSESAVRSYYTNATSRTRRQTDELAALLAQVPESEFDRDDGVFTTAEGAEFNRKLGLVTGSPIHNGYLIKQLLQASIDQVKRDYGLATVSNPQSGG